MIPGVPPITLYGVPIAQLQQPANPFQLPPALPVNSNPFELPPAKTVPSWMQPEQSNQFELPPAAPPQSKAQGADPFQLPPSKPVGFAPAPAGFVNPAPVVGLGAHSAWNQLSMPQAAAPPPPPQAAAPPAFFGALPSIPPQAPPLPSPGELADAWIQASAHQSANGGNSTASTSLPQGGAEPVGPVPPGTAREKIEDPWRKEMERQEKEDEERQKKINAAAERASIERNEGYFEPRLGYNVEGGESKYIVIDKTALGVGVFSTVYPCANKDQKLIALKIIRYQDHFRKFADQEVKILQSCKQMEDKDSEGSIHCLMMLEHFIHKRATGEEHLCMAFEHLYQNLRSTGKMSLDRVLSYSKQLLLALRFLHESVGLVHCDVKPDNLLLRHDEKAVKLCDFGTARLPQDITLQTQDELQPLFYRAPEVFMGATRGRKIDVWSAGCTIYELVVGRILFRSCLTHREIVEKIMKLCGPITQAVRDNGRLTKYYFSEKGFHPDTGEPVNPETTYRKVSMSTEIGPYVDFGSIAGGKKSAQEQAKDQLSRLIGGITVIAAATKKRKTASISEGDKRLHLLGHLIERAMDVDPSTRAAASELCKHALFEGVKPPPEAELPEAPPLPEEAPPPLPPTPPPSAA